MSPREGDSTPLALVIANRSDVGSALVCLLQWRTQGLSRSGESCFPGSLEQCGSPILCTLRFMVCLGVCLLDLILSRDCAPESESGE